MLPTRSLNPTRGQSVTILGAITSDHFALPPVYDDSSDNGGFLRPIVHYGSENGLHYQFAAHTNTSSVMDFLHHLEDDAKLFTEIRRTVLVLVSETVCPA